MKSQLFLTSIATVAISLMLAPTYAQRASGYGGGGGWRGGGRGFDGGGGFHPGPFHPGGFHPGPFNSAY